MTHAALLFTFLLSSPPPPAMQGCSLSGLWLGQDRDANAVGMWLEFGGDDSVVRANGKIIDGAWSMKGDQLTLQARPSSASEDAVALSQRVTVKVAGDVITRKAEPAILEVARQETRTRRGTSSTGVAPKVLPAPPIGMLDEHTVSRVVAHEAGQPPLVGVWGYKSKTGRTVLERYSPNRFAVLEPIAAQRGTYKVADNKLSVTADAATTDVPISCSKDSFELSVGGGKMKFVKFQ